MKTVLLAAAALAAATAVASSAQSATVVAISENPLKVQYPYQNLQADLYLEGDVAAADRDIARQATGVRCNFLQHVAIPSGQ